MNEHQSIVDQLFKLRQEKQDLEYKVQRQISSRDGLVEACHNLAETMAVDVIITLLKKSDDNVMAGYGLVLEGIQRQAREALANAKKEV